MSAVENSFLYLYLCESAVVQTLCCVCCIKLARKKFHQFIGFSDSTNGIEFSYFNSTVTFPEEELNLNNTLSCYLPALNGVFSCQYSLSSMPQKSVPSKFNFWDRLSKQVKYDAGHGTKCLYVSVAKYSSLLLKVSGFISGEGFI